MAEEQGNQVETQSEVTDGADNSEAVTQDQAGANDSLENQVGQGESNQPPEQGDGLPTREELPEEVRGHHDELLKTYQKKYQELSEKSKGIEAITKKAEFYDKLQNYEPYQKFLDNLNGSKQPQASQPEQSLDELYQAALGDDSAVGMKKFIAAASSVENTEMKRELDQLKKAYGELYSGVQKDKMAGKHKDFDSVADKVTELLQRFPNMSHEEAYKFHLAQNGSPKELSVEQVLQQRKDAATMKPGGIPPRGVRTVKVRNLREKVAIQAIAISEGKNIRVEIEKGD